MNIAEPASEAASQAPRMRDLIAAFESAVKTELTGRGWRKRNHVYTLSLDHGFDAWLGLNRASKYHPLQINPVAGLRFGPVQELLGELLNPIMRVQPTLSTPIGYLTPSRTFLQIDVATTAGASAAAIEVSDLVDAYGLPFARSYASPAQLTDAVRRREYVLSTDWQRILLPAIEYVVGDHERARAHVNEGLNHHGHDLNFPIVAQFHQFANGLLARLKQ